MRQRPFMLIAGLALALALTGCAPPEEPSDGLRLIAPVKLYGADGNMSNSFGDNFAEFRGALEGMKGTVPMTPLPDGFIHRLHGIDPELPDVNYAGESYDAVVVAAIAAELAGTTAPRRIAAQINGVTTGGEECSSVRACLALARAGGDPRYKGISLARGGFTDSGEPSVASYAIMHFDAGDRLSRGKTEFVGAGDDADTTTKPPPRADGSTARRAPLKIGGLLPRTGDLALMYPPLAAGTALAVREINAAGGVLGRPVVWRDGDGGTDPAVAQRTVREHIDHGVHVIIGAAASGVTRAVLDDVVGAGLVMISPANTAADLSTAEDDGLYFRTAPPDTLQARALADVIVRDGIDRVAIVARGDTYGEGLQAGVRAALADAGVAPDRVLLLGYQPPEGGAEPSLATQAEEIRRFAPGGVLVIGFGESAAAIKAVISAGIPLAH